MTIGLTGMTGVPTSTSVLQGLEVAGAYVMPASGNVFYVRGDGTTPTYYSDLWNRLGAAEMFGGLYPSVALALGQCVSGRGDKIIVLPGHTENLATAASWTFVNGVQIIGIGSGATRPTFTFTTATSTLVINKTGVRITNCRFLCAGPAGTTALTVAAPFTISGEGCFFDNNYFEIGIDTDQLCTTFCTIGADNSQWYNNEIISLDQTAAPTNAIVLGTGTAGCTGFKFVRNYCKSAMAAAATGLIANYASSGTSHRIEIRDNFIHQWKSDSSACISFAANQVMEGLIRMNTFRVMNNSSLVAVVQSGTGVDMTLDVNYIVNYVKETGALTGTVSA